MDKSDQNLMEIRSNSTKKLDYCGSLSRSQLYPRKRYSFYKIFEIFTDYKYPIRFNI